MGKSRLVSELLPVARGLQALQESGWDGRLWERMRHDKEFREGLTRHARELDVSMAGEKIEVEFLAGVSRQSLYARIMDLAAMRKLGISSILRKDFVMQLSRRPFPNEPRARRWKQSRLPRKVELHLTPVYRDMNLDELAEDLSARGLVSASCEEALGAALIFPYLLCERKTVVPAAYAKLRYEPPVKPLFQTKMLCFGYVIAGNSQMSLSEVKYGVSRGQHILTKRAA